MKHRNYLITAFYSSTIISKRTVKKRFLVIHAFCLGDFHDNINDENAQFKTRSSSCYTLQSQSLIDVQFRAISVFKIIINFN